MKLSDYIIHFLADRGVKKIFLVTGGACAHIVDSIGTVRQTRDIDYVCVQHEQAGAMAAEAYARVTGVPGVVVVTSGPGATNLLTGICCAWFDSIPCIYLSGQVNMHETKGTTGVRQLGFQETEIVDIVKPVTKLAYQVTDPNDIRRALEEATYISMSGRPGPVLLDIPLNIQHADIDPESIPRYAPEPLALTPQDRLEKQIDEVVALINTSKRPVIIAGGGIKLGHAVAEFRQLVDALGIPVIASWSGIDILPHNPPLYVEQYGVYGNRAANFVVQNADLVIAVGSRLDTRQTSAQGQTFARGAKKVVVDIDEKELYKSNILSHRIHADVPILADAKNFLQAMQSALPKTRVPDITEWKNYCAVLKAKYPTVLPEYYAQTGSVNSYAFIETLSRELGANDVIIPDQGGNLTWTMQAFHVQEGQQLFSTLGNSPMGYALPAAIGAAFGTESKKRVICIDGDGGFQMNIQELQTVKFHDLPIKMFILNNHGYGIIKQFQEIYFEARYEATGRGYSSPDFLRVSEAYGIPAISITNHDEMRAKIQTVLHMNGPVLCDVLLDPAQKLVPKLVADRTPDGRYISKPLEDMAPFLPRDEFNANMLIEPLEGRGEKKSSEIN